MRRIYESRAGDRDEGPSSPSERHPSGWLRAMRSIAETPLGRRLVPSRLRRRAVSVDVTTPRAEYALGTAVPFRVTMRNAMPFPVTLRTTSPILWTWSVDGVTGASHVPLSDPPDRSGEFRFARGERKRFTKRWEQSFRVSESEWEPVEPGEYTIGARINVADPVGRGLYDEESVRVVSDGE